MSAAALCNDRQPPSIPEHKTRRNSYAVQRIVELYSLHIVTPAAVGQYLAPSDTEASSTRVLGTDYGLASTNFRNTTQVVDSIRRPPAAVRYTLLLTCTDLSVSFQTTNGAVEAIDGLSLQIEPHQITCVLGPSGCGKSTLLRVMAGLIPATRGGVSIVPGEGHLIGDLRSSTAMVFQDHGLLPWLTLTDNVAFGLEAQCVPRPRRTAAARQWLDRLGMSEFADAYPYQLSVGMRQRAAIARAFLTEAPILLMDEPFAAVDAQMRLILQTELLEHWGRSRPTVVFVTHDIDEALLLGDRLVLLSRRPGRVLHDWCSNLRRPRDPTDLARPEIVEAKRMLWHELKGQVLPAAQP